MYILYGFLRMTSYINDTDERANQIVPFESLQLCVISFLRSFAEKPILSREVTGGSDGQRPLRLTKIIHQKLGKGRLILKRSDNIYTAQTAQNENANFTQKQKRHTVTRRFGCSSSRFQKNGWSCTEFWNQNIIKLLFIASS